MRVRRTASRVAGIVVRGDEHHGHRRSGAPHAAFQLQPAHARELDIQDQAVSAHVLREEILRGRKGQHGMAAGSQQPLQCIQHVEIVIDDSQNQLVHRVRHGHDVAGVARLA
jgi:hypothetical protein